METAKKIVKAGTTVQIIINGVQFLCLRPIIELSAQDIADSLLSEHTLRQCGKL